jgi:hypothetical protein
MLRQNTRVTYNSTGTKDAIPVSAGFSATLFVEAGAGDNVDLQVQYHKDGAWHTIKADLAATWVELNAGFCVAARLKVDTLVSATVALTVNTGAH